MATNNVEAVMAELSAIYKKERVSLAQDPEHVPSTDAVKSAYTLYNQMGCDKETFSERDTWDRCLNAKLYLKALNPVQASS
mmetsp:Transcript_2900/g.6745  ORF Transcript_2900/g.6745 Transcript_2900/m.6745 type:complete len:81 (+) Transcript_2900:192-434(+)|eukprot:CAMPEP_0171503858 /NCGR_PEP_ID=MMETSP0958-20121227/11176_1 /TAXON_ID=87120 /ORGANISM="Aurantiochytrium limacinum, Strain ATCCMYA-1381" /LENGTH=80 /DNA_ID=CAMNT_0012039489 /DNA_START=93 /DNA_END=335 /DNA_ORIENTATION=-